MGLWFQGHPSPEYTASQETGYARLEVYVTSQACQHCSQLQTTALAICACGEISDITLSGDSPEP